MIYHGDVILKKIKEIPSIAKKKIVTKIVLAEGEISGHAHVIADVKKANTFEHENKIYLLVKKPVELKHEEHKTIIVQPGSYEIDRIKEYDPWEEEIRRVQD